MKRIILFLLITFLSLSVFSQTRVSRNRLKTISNPNYRIASSAQFPPVSGGLLDSLLNSMWNINDDGIVPTTTFVANTYVPYNGATTNVNLATRSLTAAIGTFTGGVISPTVYGSTSASGILNLMSTSNATKGTIQIGTSTGTTVLNSGYTSMTGSINIGNAANNPSALGALRIGQGTSKIDIGEQSSGIAAIWLNQTTPSTSNFAFLSAGSDISFNAPSASGTIYFALGNSSTKASFGPTLTVLSNTTVVGSATAAPTNTLGSAFAVGDGASILRFGKFNTTGTSAIWGSTVTPTVNNYNLAIDPNNANVYLHAGTELNFVTNANLRGGMNNSRNYFTLPTAIGGNGTPAATLHVMGTFSVSSTATITGQLNTGVIVGSQIEATSTMYADTKLRVGSVATPSAMVHIAAGTTAANNAPLKLTVAGASLQTTPETGAIETDANGTLYYTPGASRYQITTALTNTATLNFGSTLPATSAELTITVTGAAVGDAVAIGLPTAPDANSSYTGYVSATNTVTIRFNNYSALSIDPASATFKAIVIKN